ncbi:MAG: hypothetical protein IT184_05095 [Acidobacteria bacterium]|nr:hypothetical protein [Acidobacteriota bacterium]
MRAHSVRTRLTRRGALAACAVWLWIGIAAAAAPALTSVWRSQPLTIDGAPAEWPPLTSLEAGPAVGVQNDGEFLYVVVSAADQKWRPLLEGGLVVWLDPKGGKAQTFGIWLPGPAEPAPPGATPMPAATAGPSGVSTDVLDQFDLLGPGKSQRRLVDVTPEIGVEVASGLIGDAVVYEIKVPLLKTEARPYAVAAAPGATIGIGLATPEMPRRQRRRQDLVGSTGQVGGYQPGIPGYTPYIPGMGGRGYTPYAQKDERPKPLLVWSTLKLAK